LQLKRLTVVLEELRAHEHFIHDNIAVLEEAYEYALKVLVPQQTVSYLPSVLFTMRDID